MKQKPIVILGGGGIGRATALLLADSDPSIPIRIGDIDLAVAEDAVQLVRRALAGQADIAAFTVDLARDLPPDVEHFFEPRAILLDCLPGAEVPRAARFARHYEMHYANLTEYVAETAEALEIARGAETAFVLQCGLAPGYINVAAKALFDRACYEWKVSRVGKILMRVGALSAHASSPAYYAWTWSPVGVVTEYLEPALVVRDGRQLTLPSLSERNLRVVDGITYEEALTSGGVADLATALVDRVDQLDYMTLRWPGHYDYIDRVLAATPAGVGREHWLRDTMEHDIPHVEDDVVVLYVMVEGLDNRGLKRRLEHAVHLEPVRVRGTQLRAIQAATAASLAEVAKLIAKGELAGPVLQSQIPPSGFLDGATVRSVYGRLSFGPEDTPASAAPITPPQVPILTSHVGR